MKRGKIGEDEEEEEGHHVCIPWVPCLHQHKAKENQNKTEIVHLDLS